jgi:hypothetical protein
VIVRARPAAIAALLVVLGACTGGPVATPSTAHSSPVVSPSAPAPTPSTGSTGLPRFSHVVIVIFENKEYGDVIDNPAAPYFTSLAHTYGLATEFFATTHPSLPNYIALVAGSTLGVTRNCRRCTVSGTSLIDQLESAGMSWKAYMEGAAGPCDPGAPPAPRKPNPAKFPFLYFDGIAKDATRCDKVVPLTQLSADLADGGLPEFAWITPNLCHSMHDCPVGDGDAFLKSLMPSLLQGVGPDGAVFVTFDEGSTDAGCCRLAAGGHVPTIVAGPAVAPGAVSAVRYDHYSILRTIEQAWGLPLLRQAACSCTAPMTALFRTG